MFFDHDVGLNVYGSISRPVSFVIPAEKLTSHEFLMEIYSSLRHVESNPNLHNVRKKFVGLMRMICFFFGLILAETKLGLLVQQLATFEKKLSVHQVQSQKFNIFRTCFETDARAAIRGSAQKIKFPSISANVLET
jgi:hypothetical protein